MKQFILIFCLLGLLSSNVFANVGCHITPSIKPKPSNSCPSIKPKPSNSCSSMIPEPSNSCPSMIPEPSNSCPSMIPEPSNTPNTTSSDIIKPSNQITDSSTDQVKPSKNPDNDLPKTGENYNYILLSLCGIIMIGLGIFRLVL